MADERDEDELDEDEQRYSDPWGMTYRDCKVFGRWLVVICAVICAVIMIVFLLCQCR